MKGNLQKRTKIFAKADKNGRKTVDFYSIKIVRFSVLVAKPKIKPFFLLALLRRSVKRVCGAYLHDIAPS